MKLSLTCKSVLSDQSQGTALKIQTSLSWKMTKSFTGVKFPNDSKWPELKGFTAGAPSPPRPVLPNLLRQVRGSAARMSPASVSLRTELKASRRCYIYYFDTQASGVLVTYYYHQFTDEEN